MSNQKTKGRVLGLHVYNDERGRLIYYNVFNKKAYWVNDQTDYKKFSVFQTRLPLSIALGFIVIMFLDMLWFGLISGILVYVLMSIYFYVKFLPSLKEIKNFERPKESFMMRFVGPLSDTRIIIAIIMIFLIAILLVVNVQISEYDEITEILNYVLAAGVAIFGFMLIGAFFKKKKLNK